MLIGSKPMIKSISNRQPNVIIENKPIKQVYDCVMRVSKHKDIRVMYFNP
jgi:hypothetical protein